MRASLTPSTLRLSRLPEKIMVYPLSSSKTISPSPGGSPSPLGWPISSASFPLLVVLSCQGPRRLRTFQVPSLCTSRALSTGSLWHFASASVRVASLSVLLVSSLGLSSHLCLQPSSSVRSIAPRSCSHSLTLRG